jgi:hypothetical protein
MSNGHSRCGYEIGMDAPKHLDFRQSVTLTKTYYQQSILSQLPFAEPWEHVSTLPALPAVRAHFFRPVAVTLPASWWLRSWLVDAIGDQRSAA